MLSKKEVGNPEDPQYVRFVGLDLSLTGTGLVALDIDGKVLHAKSWGYSLERGVPTVKSIQRLVRIARFVFEGVEANSFEVTEPGKGKPPWEIHPRIGIEGYAFSRGGAGRKAIKKPGKKAGKTGGGDAYGLGELGGTIKTQLWLRWNIVPHIIVSSSARKTVFGNGRMTKSEIMRECKARGFSFRDHNVADGYVIAETLRLRHIEQGKQNES